MEQAKQQEEEIVLDVEDATADGAEAQDGAQEPEAEAEGTESPKAKGKGFGKKDKKNKKESKQEEQIGELNDKLMRTMAEFDNFRKRSEKEKTQMFEVGAKSIIEKMLPIIDNFERGLGSVPEAEKENGFVQGMEQIYKQLMTALEGVGVKPIEAVGKEFDPNFHNAVMHAEDDSFGENIVSEELQKGYLYHDSVVRHSMVKVVN